MDWPEATRYKAVISAQRHRQEIIQDLYTTRDGEPGGMIMELLQSFNRSTGRAPERIIFYRDGVGESQFHNVMVTEMARIRSACNTMKYYPSFTYIVMQKRHHTCFFPATPENVLRNGNIFPGTVVDTHVCHPHEFDFYLCSHAGTKKTEYRLLESDCIPKA
ncbi:protein argonaute 1C-like [Helianthus annuus]|uniref:protein argonaute 1C-like n=1 Tax=Helianthus annuus TaxID=4232 RepID=UPI000B90331E|nr:protein argonaute 1C-like [Helianthus annuus]